MQPQWIFDCVNQRTILPVDEYLPDAVLPPHLSPFVEEENEDYIPPERTTDISEDTGLQTDVSTRECKGEIFFSIS